MGLFPEMPPPQAQLAGVFSSLGNFWNTLTSVDPGQVKGIAEKHLWLALLLCFGSGILTSLTPCVYPIIPITINIFGRVSQKHYKETVRGFNPRSFYVAIIYVMGMSFTYCILGLVSGLTGSLFGSLLQSSFMLGLLTGLFFILALGQFGLFKIALPASWQAKLSQVGHTRNRFGIFLMGAISGIIVSPCVGPILAGILAFVFESSNAFLGGLYFFSFSLGLGVLFLLIGGFSGVISHLPRSGRWMMAVNRVLAALLLVASGYYGLLWMKKLGVTKRSIPITSQEKEGGIAWYHAEPKALAVADKLQRPMMIDFTAEWCEACHEIEAQVFQDPNAIEKLRDFIALRIDVTEDTPENTAVLNKYGVMSLPTIVFVNQSGEILNRPRIHGVIPVNKFLALLKKVQGR